MFTSDDEEAMLYDRMNSIFVDRAFSATFQGIVVFFPENPNSLPLIRGDEIDSLKK